MAKTYGRKQAGRGRHFDVILLKSTATVLAAAMFVGYRTTASTSLAGAAAVVPHNIYPAVVLLAGGSSRAMLASARLPCFELLHEFSRTLVTAFTAYDFYFCSRTRCTFLAIRSAAARVCVV